MKIGGLTKSRIQLASNIASSGHASSQRQRHSETKTEARTVSHLRVRKNSGQDVRVSQPTSHFHSIFNPMPVNTLNSAVPDARARGSILDT